MLRSSIAALAPLRKEDAPSKELEEAWEYNGVESAKSDNDAAEDTRVSSAAVSA